MNSTTLDVILAMAFVYLSYSLFVSITGELWSSLFGLRARTLDWAILRMLNGTQKRTLKITGFLEAIWLGIVWLFKKNRKNLHAAFYNDPNIEKLSQNGLNNTPSYITTDRFVDTLYGLLVREGMRLEELEYLQTEKQKKELPWEILNALEQVVPAPGAITEPPDDPMQSDLDFIERAISPDEDGNYGTYIPKETAIKLQWLLKTAQHDLDRFKAELGKWFEETMNRTTGWYKRKMRLVNFFLAMVIALWFNVDSVMLVKKLNANPQLLQQVVAQAEDVAKHPNFMAAYDQSKLEGLTGEAYLKELDRQTELIAKHIGKLNNTVYISNEESKAKYGKNWRWNWRRWLSCLLTALALSLGAPFWFDLLKKIVQIRTSVPPPPPSQGTDTGPIKKVQNSAEA